MTHGEFARANFLNALNAPTKEWSIVLLFYAAVHAANHVIYNGADVTDRFDHEKRIQDIEKNKLLRSYSKQYRQLKTLSETARYKPFLHPMKDEQVAHAKHLAKIFLDICGIPTDEPTPTQTATPESSGRFGERARGDS